MKRISREMPGAEARTETANPLWIITAMVAIFFAVAGVLIAWG